MSEKIAAARIQGSFRRHLKENEGRINIFINIFIRRSGLETLAYSPARGG